MEYLSNLLEGYPNLWSGGVAHSVLILALVISLGIVLGKIRVCGVSLGVTWILFVGIVFGHYNLNLDEHLLHFLKEFGLILFVYSIGLQVGPGFFSAFKEGGLSLNMLASGVVFLGVVITVALHFVTGIPITTMVGIMSGAVTNTPGLGAAQQANSDLTGIDAPEIALGYAVAYPLGVVGCILSLLALRSFFRVDLKKEEKAAEEANGLQQDLTVRPVTIEIHNEAVDGKKIREIHPLLKRQFVISRISHASGEGTELAGPDTVLRLNDRILVISNPVDIEAIMVFFGREVEMTWEGDEAQLISRRILITKPELNGKTLAQLKIRNNFGANITRINRAGVDLVASPQLRIQMGDRVEILTNKNSKPSRDWLSIVKTPSARSKIRHYFAAVTKDDDAAAGREMLARDLRKRGYGISTPRSTRALNQVCDELNYKRLEDLFAAVGAGKQTPRLVGNRVQQILDPKPEIPEMAAASVPVAPARGSNRRPQGSGKGGSAVVVKGSSDSGLLVRLAHCCNPVMGDDIVGFITRGRGVSVHRADCPNVKGLMEHPERMIEVGWDSRADAAFRVEIVVECLDRMGLLKDVTIAIGDAGANILSAATSTNRDGVAVLRFLVEISDASGLDPLLAAISRVESVYDARRLKPGEGASQMKRLS